MTTRNGKIARLPFELREEINHRLLENQPVKDILIWLSTDSSVIAVLEKLFESRPITEQNVSEWRQGGYQEWLIFRGCLENVQEVSEDAARVARTGVNAEHLLMVLTATYAELLKKWGTMPEIAFNQKIIVLQDLTKMALAMRRSEQRDARLEIDRERLELLRDKQSDSDSSPSSSSSRASSANTRPRAVPILPPPKRPNSAARQLPNQSANGLTRTIYHRPAPTPRIPLGSIRRTQPLTLNPPIHPQSPSIPINRLITFQPNRTQESPNRFDSLGSTSRTRHNRLQSAIHNPQSAISKTV